MAQLDVEGPALVLGEQFVRAEADVDAVQIQLIHQGAVVITDRCRPTLG